MVCGAEWLWGMKTSHGWTSWTKPDVTEGWCETKPKEYTGTNPSGNVTIGPTMDRTVAEKILVECGPKDRTRPEKSVWN